MLTDERSDWGSSASEKEVVIRVQAKSHRPHLILIKDLNQCLDGNVEFERAQLHEHESGHIVKITQLLYCHLACDAGSLRSTVHTQHHRATMLATPRFCLWFC